MILYHRWSSMPAQSVRLALAAKRAPHEAIPVTGEEDELWLELGIGPQPLSLVRDEAIHTDAIAILESLDAWLPATPPLLQGFVSDDDWRRFLGWRTGLLPLLERLYASVLPAFRDMPRGGPGLADYEREVERRFHVSIGTLVGDRFAAYRQLDEAAGFRALARRLAKERYYAGGTLTAIDIVLACDLFPLQLHDGITLPLDLMYWIRSIEEACSASLAEAVVVKL